ncbi:hypothetical protein NP233_g5190 [Leucocoprinus birnbaumii]|uniref:Uncharacterized protein n=1 Tax=Leucocoprinus birnbaumii TaxID=56174 RepID=A0AAD5YWY7_9AGAR|nr:hypothetical protein NP233_g5190 [Leucocoprinus birnbaumii]
MTNPRPIVFRTFLSPLESGIFEKLRDNLMEVVLLLDGLQIPLLPFKNQKSHLLIFKSFYITRTSWAEICNALEQLSSSWMVYASNYSKMVHSYRDPASEHPLVDIASRFIHGMEVDYRRLQEQMEQVRTRMHVLFRALGLVNPEGEIATHNVEPRVPAYEKEAASQIQHAYHQLEQTLGTLLAYRIKHLRHIDTIINSNQAATISEMDAAVETWERFKVYLEDFCEKFYRISRYFRGTGPLRDPSLQVTSSYDGESDSDEVLFETFSYDFAELGISLLSPVFTHLANSNSKSLARLSTFESLPDSERHSQFVPSHRHRSLTAGASYRVAVPGELGDAETPSLSEDVTDTSQDSERDAPHSTSLEHSTSRVQNMAPAKGRRRLKSLPRRLLSFLRLR